MAYLSSFNACAARPNFSPSFKPYKVKEKMPSLVRPLSGVPASAPIIDFSLYTNGNASARAACSSRTLELLSRLGYARVINTEIDRAAIDNIFNLSNDFFKLPRSAKSQISNPKGPNPQRGYSHVGAESSSTLYAKLVGKESSGLSDAREHFDQGPKCDRKFPNRWPQEQEIPGFRSAMESFFESAEQVSFQILGGLEEALLLPAGTFTGRIGGASELRLNHYPAISLEQMRKGSVNRIWPHFDLGVLTLLWIRGEGGLEFEDRSAVEKPTFMPVELDSPYELVISTCETFQRWTNDAIPAALHQVTIPPRLKDVENGDIAERFSIAFFCKADRDAGVGSLAEFVGPAERPRYEDLTALEYHRRRLQAAY